MKATQLIALLQAAVAEHGDIEVVARRFGDYLASGPTLWVEKRVRYPHFEESWVEPEPEWATDEQPQDTQTVAFLDH